MTLTHNTNSPLQRIHQLTVHQGLSTSGESLSDRPTVADIRRLRRLVPLAWVNLSSQEKWELYREMQGATTVRPSLMVLSAVPQAFRAMRHLIRTEGLEGVIQYGQVVGLETQALVQEVFSLWENEHSDLATRVEAAVQLAQIDRGTRVKTRDDVRAVLDDLF